MAEITAILSHTKSTRTSDVLEHSVGEINGNVVSKGLSYYKENGIENAAEIKVISSPYDYSKIRLLTQKSLDDEADEVSRRLLAYHMSNPIPEFSKKIFLDLRRRFDAAYPNANSDISSKSPEKPVGRPSGPPSKNLSPVAAKPTYSVPEELAKLAKQKPSGKPPSQAEEKERDGLRKAWQSKNRLVTPFIGGWIDPKGQELFVYPSTKPRVVCFVRKIDDKYAIDQGAVMGNAEGKDVTFDTTKQLFNLGKPNAIAIRNSSKDPLQQLTAIPGSPDLNASDKEELEQRECITSLPGAVLPSKFATKTSIPDATQVICKGEAKPVKMISVEVIQPNASAGILGYDRSGNRSCDDKPIEATKRHIFFREIQNPPNPQKTWIVIHGWNNDSRTGGIQDIAKALSSKSKNDRVLILDWSEAAFSASDRKLSNFGIDPWGVYYAATWIRPVAEAAVEELKTKYGITPSEASERLVLVGHSLGSLMSAEMGAVYMGMPANGKSNQTSPVVRAIIALDPPSEGSVKGLRDLGGYDVDIRTPGYIFKKKTLGIFTNRDIVRENIESPKEFNKVAKFSRAFVGSTSIAGNKGFASTAHESFTLKFDSLLNRVRSNPGSVFTKPTQEHGDVVSSFAMMLSKNTFSGVIGLNALRPLQRVKPNSNGFTGEILIGEENQQRNDMEYLLLEHNNESIYIQSDGNVYSHPPGFKFLGSMTGFSLGKATMLFP
jgi:pimeloyl-ACP methyl ester carboxylesterase